MIDLVALLAGGFVGVLLGVAVLGIRRSRPLPAAPGARAARPSPAPPPAPSAPQASGYPIRVNRPAPPSPPVPVAPPPPVATAPAGPTVARLEVIDGPTVPLGAHPITIGRGRDQALRVADERASRAHAVVRPRTGGGWELVDAGSANGTTLNGARIPDGRVAPLRVGDRIGIGGTVVTYQEERGGPAPAPAPGPDATQVL